MAFFSRLLSRARTRIPLPSSKRKPRRFVPHLETLEGRVLMHSGAGAAAMDAEHLAVFGSRDATTHVITGGLVPDAAVTYQSVASGNWSDPNVWLHVNHPNDGTIPSSNDNVLVSLGTTVTVDGNEAVANGQRVALRTVRVDGALTFDPHANTTLLVDTVIVEPGGAFQMGTPQQPIDPQHRARLIFADLAKSLDDAYGAAAPGTTAWATARLALTDYEAQRTAWDPLQFGLGLVTHGGVQINGTPVTSWLQGGVDAAKNPLELAKGSTTINLGNDANGNPIRVPATWKAGDHIIIPGTQPTLPYYLGGGIDSDDEVQISGISKTTLSDGTVVNGTTFTISTPLQYDHKYGSFYVADVVRNATFESENPGIVARRGHVMFMHNPGVQVANAGFYGLGRTDKRRPIDDPVVVADTDNPGQNTTDVLLANPNPDLAGKTVPLSDGTVVINGDLYENGQLVKHVQHRVLAQIFDPVSGKYLLQLGRTGLNPRGRYAVHFHRTGDTTPVTISGSAVVDSPGWGIVNHSSNVDVEDNVVFNAFGAAYVTEAGDEVGTFNHNIAIKGLGSGEQVDSRKNINDFGHDGDGFWFQGGNVTVTNNVAAGMRHAGYVFFPRGLVQKGFTPPQTMIPGDDLPASYGADPTLMYDVADVPLLKFQGNTAFGDGDGYESWFSLQHTHLHVRTVIQDFTVFAVTGDAIFTPYTSLDTFQNVTVRDPVDWAGVKLANPTYTGFSRNDLTSDFIYDHVTVTGFSVGINAPVVGVNTIVGGTFNNLQNIQVTTTNADTRVLNINDAGPSDPVHFLDSLKKLVNGQWVPYKQYDIYLQANWQPLFDDITRNFARDIVRIGLVSHNGQQVYFKEQAYNFTPYPSQNWLNQYGSDPTKPHGPLAAPWVPVELQDHTNAELWAQYGIAIGGVVAPQNAIPDPLINGIVGPATTYAPPTYLWSQKWFDDRKGAYYPIYSYWDPSRNNGLGGYAYIDESKTDAQGHHLYPAVPLHGGWNVIPRSFTYMSNGQLVTQPVTLLVYDENQDPSFLQANPGQVLNLADVNNGTVFNLSGWIVASYGKVNFTATVKLNDPTYVSALKTRADGTQYVTISFFITNFAGTTTKISIDFNVTTTAALIKDTGQVYLPYMDLSLTLKKLLGM